ncbi:FtsK/SpoIIIE domain-containing protein [Thermomonospora amylolytica]|uniref:FtsK/SpoIIIE domain-containing protein n=1 Tax=Thermomonospora amylolytica TaxID=1411117 RepID=UPI000E6D17A6|nr:FtsK/SpoIIIE domain-containing protein [Thermomonospora amylolytica]
MASPDERGADVVPLYPGGPPPAFGGRQAQDVEEVVYEGEIVEDSPESGSDDTALVPARRFLPVPWVDRHTDHVAWAVAQTALRAGWTIGRGHTVWASRALGALTYRTYREQIRAARAAGDIERLAEWIDKYQAAKRARWDRIASAPATVIAALQVLGLVLAIVGAVLLIIGIAVAMRDGGWTWHTWWAFVADTLAAVGMLTQIVLGMAMVSAPVGWLAAAYQAGKGTDLPRWLVPDRQTVQGEPVTPGRVVLALRDLGIPALRKAVQEAGDGAGGWLSPIRIAGCGVEVDVTLPTGVSTQEIQARRRKLAENLDRHEHELHITIPPAARTVRLWIADSGALDEPIGPSPLVTDADLVADFYTGKAPWGQDLRGDMVALPLLQRHLLITGLSNQGKTAALRALALWAALDRTVEFRIADLKGVGDWRPFDGIATTLIQGPTDEHVMQATHMLETGVEEMERRLTALEESGATDGITRDMARRPGSGFHPLILIVDEAQQAFMCPVVGEDKRPYGGTKHTSRYFMAARKIHNQGRAVNVHLWQGTQDPTDQNLPKLVREGAHIRASLVVGTEAQAKMALGDKAVNAGAAPHALRQGLDKGTLVVTGDGVPVPAGQASVTVRTHFISGEDAAAIAERAKRLRGPVTTSTGQQPTPQRDHLADIERVMRGERRVRTEIIRQRLAELDPTVYEGWTAQNLAAALAEHGIQPRKSDGVMVVRNQDVQDALNTRQTTEQATE